MTLFSDCKLNPIALSKCVFPRPTPPQIYKGLYLETCSQTFLE